MYFRTRVQLPAPPIFLRGASPLGLPYTRSRSPLRRLAPIAWLTRSRSLAPRDPTASPLGLPYTRSRSPLRRLAPIAWLTRSRSLAPRDPTASPLGLAFHLDRGR